jgi:hypothetical protein
MESRVLLSRLFSFEQDEGFTRTADDGKGARVAEDPEGHLKVGDKENSHFLWMTIPNSNQNTGTQRYETTLPTGPGDTFRVFGSFDRNANNEIGYGRVVLVSANNSAAQHHLLYMDENTIGYWQDSGNFQVWWSGDTPGPARSL